MQYLGANNSFPDLNLVRFHMGCLDVHMEIEAVVMLHVSFNVSWSSFLLM